MVAEVWGEKRPAKRSRASLLRDLSGPLLGRVAGDNGNPVLFPLDQPAAVLGEVLADAVGAFRDLDRRAFRRDRDLTTDSDLLSLSLE